MTTIALSTDETVLVLKLVFLVLLYAFILFVARTATRDLGGAPQESIVLGAAEAEKLRAKLVRPARFRVLDGPGLRAGSDVEILVPTVVGRESTSDLRLDDDDFASARHARIEPRPDGTWVEDLGSTNGTFVNDDPVTTPRKLVAGDRLRIGQTELRLEG